MSLIEDEVCIEGRSAHCNWLTPVARADLVMSCEE